MNILEYSPLGKLSRGSVEKAIDILKYIEENIDCNDPRIIIDLSNQFYSHIPSISPELIDTKTLILKKFVFVKHS